MAAARSRLAGCRGRTMVAPVFSLLVSVCTVPATYSLEGYQSGIRPARAPVKPVPRPDRSYVRLSLKAASPRSRGKEYRSVRRTGLYPLKDSFGHQDSAVFNGTPSGGNARVLRRMSG